MSILAKVKEWFQRLSQEPFPMSDPLQKPWTTRDSNRTLFKVLSTNTPNKPALPTELILQILAHPSTWLLTTSVYLATPARVSSSESERAIIHTPPMSNHQLPLIRRIVFTYSSKDQGWSSYSSDHGTHRNSWTWFEAGLRKHAEEEEGEEKVSLTDQTQHRYRLHCNRHAGWATEDYQFVLEGDHPLLKNMQAGDEVVLWAMAKFGGWENYVHGAAIQIWTMDDLNDV